MDEMSHRLANLAVGNEPDTATLEITLIGPALEFERDAIVAWAGAGFSVSAGDEWLPPWSAHLVRAGEVLNFGNRSHGIRAYLAVAGGFDLQSFMGSYSTNQHVGQGGHQGRALRRGDRIGLGAAPARPRVRAVANWIEQNPESRLFLDPCAQRTDSVRLLPGREWAQFTGQSRGMLTGSVYRLSPRSDRMGYRLEGAPLERSSHFDILSEPVDFGTVQVPPDGQPIVLMAERQSVGGYPRIAQVAAVDLPRMAQLAPGDPLSFTMVDMATAQRLLLAREQILQAIAGLA